MRKDGFSQEMLKGIACVTMVLDHIGAVFVPGYTLRIIGRISFPIFCFLLAEGARRTRSPGRYALRLGLSALLSELPFDMLFYGGINWQHQSVMVTLLIGLVTVLGMKKLRTLQILPLAAGILLAELLHTDYGGFGVALIGLFSLVADHKWKNALGFIGMAVIFWAMDSVKVPVLGLIIPIQMFGLLAMVPIWLYSGRKVTGSRGVQMAFYLFYPVHLLILLLNKKLLALC